MNAKERQARLARLTSAWLDGVASDAELRELNDRLRGDPDACELFLDLVDVHAALTHDHAGDAIALQMNDLVGYPAPRQDQPARRRLGPFSPVAGMAIAAGLALLIVAVSLIRTGSPGSSDPSLLAGHAVAVISRLVDPEWAESGPVYAEGRALPPGPFALRAGLAQIEFFSGATVIVEGPVELTLENAWSLVCHRGRLRAFVPEPARGFTILTPDYHAVDLGTEFALSVEKDGRSEVHVVDGEVRLDDPSGRELHRLEAGAGIRTDRGGAFEAVAHGGTGFIDRQRLLTLSREDGQSRLQGWRLSREALRADPATEVLFDFEEQQPWDRQLQNRAAGRSHGAIVGAQWTQGRWPEKSALEFKRITDRVRMEVPGDFEALTLAAWIRIEGLDRWLSSILLTDGFDPGEVHWQISDLGELILGIGGENPPNAASPPTIHPSDLGRWLHLAVTVDRATNRVTHYRDGRAIARRTYPDLPPLRIGTAEIGNWRPEGKPNAIRSLNGRLDEFVILSRALSAPEIAHLHATGTP